MKRVQLYLAILVFTGFAWSRESTGYLVNRKGEPVEFATVVLFAEQKQVAATITDEKGVFCVSVGEGTYRMVVQNISYELLEEDIEVEPGKTGLGTFILEETSIGLEAVTVTASVITREPDRYVMRINDNLPSLINKDASEVLQLAPGVWVNDDGISINGSGGTKVFINNRELKLDAKELSAYLRNYRSSDIARVEVIPQAGADFSADSRGGVIRIILRKQQERGVEGNAMAQTTKAKHHEEYRPSVTVNALSGKWTWNASGTGMISPRNKDMVSEYRNYDTGGDNRFQSYSVMKSKPVMGMGRFGVIYDLNSRNSIGGQVEFWSEKDNIRTSVETTGNLDGNAIDSRSDYRQRDNNRNRSATLDYMHQLDTMGSVVKLIADYTKKKVTGNNDYHTLSRPDFNPVDSAYRSNSLSDYTIYTADLTADKQLRNGMKLTTGVRYTHNKVVNNAFYEGWLSDWWIPLNDYNYALDYSEGIGAVYGTLSAKIASFGLQAGLRGEYTHVKGKGMNGKSYFDVFPNLNLTYSFDPMQILMLVGQYARNIQRPNFWHLNSNRVQYSDYSYIIGNPHLKPTYIDRVNLTFVYHYRYTLTVGTNLHKDLIREVTKSDPVDERIKYVIPENHYMENHHFVAISLPLQVTKYISVNNNFVGVKQDIKAEKSDKIMEHYLWFLNSTANITLPATTYLEFTYSGTSRLYSANSGIKPSHLLHAQLKKSFCDNRLNLTLGVNNLFNRKASYFARMDTYNSCSEIVEARNARVVKVSVQYNFKLGKSLKKRAQEYNREAKKERLEKGGGLK